MELRVAGHRHLFEAIDYAAYGMRNHTIWMDGANPRIEADLIAGKGVAVSEVFANQTGLEPGDRYRISIAETLLDVPILGVFRDYRTRGGMVLYSLSHYQKRFGDRLWSGVQVNFDHDGNVSRENLDRVRSALVACCGDVIEMTEGVSLRREILRIFDETFAITTVLLLIALVVAGLGIATTLVVLVLQRNAQIHTIRALGGSAAQLRHMIVWEASLIVMAGQAAGLACGFILSVLLIFVVNRQSFGWTFLYRVDWPALLSALPLIFAAALLAAWPAVRLALRGSPATLLRGGNH
jgi:putative ABC transport system permease protein